MGLSLATATEKPDFHSRVGLLIRYYSFYLALVGFDGKAGADQVAVAVDVVYAGDGGPELAAAHPFGGEGGCFS